MKHIINPKTHPLRPAHFNVANTDNNGFYGTRLFGERITAARHILEFCAKRKSFAPFKLADIQKWFARDHKDQEFSFGGLDTAFYLVEIKGQYHLTHEFLLFAFKAIPAANVLGKQPSIKAVEAKTEPESKPETDPETE